MFMTISPSFSDNSCFPDSFHVSAYPLPDSFPQFGSDGHPQKSKPRVVQSYTSLTNSSNVSRDLEKYALFVEGCVKRRGPVIASLDVPLDDLKDLANDLWTMHDNSAVENDGASAL